MSLRELSVSNIVLIDSVHLTFKDGLIVLTGETGAGKSSLLSALDLTRGSRFDTNLLRTGCDQALVEAVFEVDFFSEELAQFFNKHGICHSLDEPIIIKREFMSNGKNRSFINHQRVQLQLLQELSKHLISFTRQHEVQELFSKNTHRKMIDLFGNHSDLVKSFDESFNEELILRKKLTKLQNEHCSREQQILKYREQIMEIQEANLLPGEEEELFSEYSLHDNADQLQQHLQSLTEGMSENSVSVLSQMQQLKYHFQELCRINPHSFCSLETQFENVMVELQDLSYNLTKQSGKLEANPKRMEELNIRLSFIHNLKKKYGTTIEEVINYSEKIRSDCERLENNTHSIETMEKEIHTLSLKNNELAKTISQKRKASSEQFQHKIERELFALNMPHAQFFTELQKKDRTAEGDETIEFFIIPNLGEKKIPIKDAASGGELSRLMLAVHTILAGRTHVPTLIFDEIDANIGGQTAKIVGEKLKHLAKTHQIVCVTHFPQVAQFANQHFTFTKHESSGRTLTNIQDLDVHHRQEELKRMLGGVTISTIS